MKQLGSTDLKRLHRSWNHRTNARIALLLEDLQSPWNVGSIVRTAAALRADHLYLAHNTISPDHAKAGKTSMGTERYVTWSEFGDASSAIAQADADGYRVVGLELTDEAKPIMEADLNCDVCLVIGNEDHGLSKSSLESCRSVVYVPQLGRVGSLNVAAATAIAMYEVRRRHWSANND